MSNRPVAEDAEGRRVIRHWLYRAKSGRRRARAVPPRTITTPHLILVTWCAFRVAALGKALADSPLVVGTAASPTAAWTLLGLVLLESMILLVALIRSSGVPGYPIVIVDVVLTGMVAISPLFYSHTELSPLLPWHFALILTTVSLVAMRFTSTAWTVAVVGLLGVLYLLGRGKESIWTSTTVGLASAFTMLMVFAVAAAFSRHLMEIARRMEDLVETNVRLAARAAVANERATQRVFLHDTAGLLAMIANTTDPQMNAVLRNRARATSKELRAYVYEERETEAGPSRSLHEVLERVAAEFRDVPIERNLLLAKIVFLTGDAIQAVESALRTVLDNIRVHANARNVMIHGRSLGGGWEVTVRDDGVGFDPARTKKGFGLRDQVESQCALAGISVRIDSRPGEGTEVRLQGTSSPLVPKASQPVTSRRHQATFVQQWRTVRRQARTRP